MLSIRLLDCAHKAYVYIMFEKFSNKFFTKMFHLKQNYFN